MIERTPEDVARFESDMRTIQLSRAELAERRPKPKARSVRIRIAIVCNECGHKWRVSPDSDPQCSKCNGVDYEVLSWSTARRDALANATRAPTACGCFGGIDAANCNPIR